MALISGSQILARALKQHGVDTMFYIMGGPMLSAELACIDEGIHPRRVTGCNCETDSSHAFVCTGQAAAQLAPCSSAVG